MKPFEYPELKPACPAAPMCNCTGGCENKTESLPMGNTKALAMLADENDSTRLYIPLAGGYVWQTKGRGSTVRLYGPDGEWQPISWHPDWIEKLLDECVLAQYKEINSLRTQLESMKIENAELADRLQDKRAQLAERDAQLAAERSRIYKELVRLAELAQANKNSAKFHSPGWPEMQSALIRLYRTLEATRQPTQDKGE